MNKTFLIALRRGRIFTLDDDNPPGLLMLDTDALRLMETRSEAAERGDVTAWADPPAFTDFPAEHWPTPGSRERAPRLRLESQHE